MTPRRTSEMRTEERIDSLYEAIGMLEEARQMIKEATKGTRAGLLAEKYTLPCLNNWIGGPENTNQLGNIFDLIKVIEEEEQEAMEGNWEATEDDE
jgi:hypothetical protein